MDHPLLLLFIFFFNNKKIPENSDTLIKPTISLKQDIYHSKNGSLYIFIIYINIINLIININNNLPIQYSYIPTHIRLGVN